MLMGFECPDLFSLSFSLLVVPADWFSNADSLRESFRIASSLDWANIDLTCHPGQYSTMMHNLLSFSAVDSQFSFKGSILEFVQKHYFLLLGNCSLASYKLLINENNQATLCKKIATLNAANKT